MKSFNVLIVIEIFNALDAVLLSKKITTGLVHIRLIDHLFNHLEKLNKF